MLLDELLRGLEVPALTLRLGSLGSLEARGRVPRGAGRATCARHEDRAGRRRARADRREPAARLRLQARGDAGRDGGGADDARTARRRRRRALRDRPPPSGARRHRLRAGRRPWCAGSTTTPGRCSSSTAAALGAQSQVAGGGRYDGLIELLGGPATPACGWAVGVERILLALEGEQTRRPPDVFVAAGRRPAGARAGARHRASPRRACAPSSTSAGRGLKGQMRHADRIGVRQHA